MHQPSKNSSTHVAFLFVCIILQKSKAVRNALLFYKNVSLLHYSSGYNWLMAFITNEYEDNRTSFFWKYSFRFTIRSSKSWWSSSAKCSRVRGEVTILS